jgi:hypothetical protein
MVDIKQKIKEVLDDKTFTYLERIGYFTSPASAGRHLAINGGLALHSYNVYIVLLDIVHKYNIDITDKEVASIALLHDVCKSNCYIDNVLTSGKVSEAKPYKFNDTLPLGHGDKSVIMLLQEGIELTDKEMMCIRYHMGDYTYTDMSQWDFAKNLITKAGYWEVVMATHLADMMASQVLEGKEELYSKLYI